jgi:hypothetical protein
MYFSTPTIGCPSNRVILVCPDAGYRLAEKP